MPKLSYITSLSPLHVTPIQRFWRAITLRPLKQYKLYMIRPDNVHTDEVGCDDEIVPVNRLTTASAVSLTIIYEDLLSLHDYEYGDGLVNALWGSDLHLIAASVDGNDVAHIELGGTLAAREVCSVPRIRSQLTLPAKQLFSGSGHVRTVEVTIEGRPLEELLKSS